MLGFAALTPTYLELIRDGALRTDFDDELVAKSCVSHAGETRL